MVGKMYTFNMGVKKTPHELVCDYYCKLAKQNKYGTKDSTILAESAKYGRQFSNNNAYAMAYASRLSK